MHFCDRVFEYRDRNLKVVMHELTVEHLFDSMGRKSRHQKSVRDSPVLFIFVCPVNKASPTPFRDSSKGPVGSL